MVELDKPFKTIEVIDSGTSQVCKVACMSCIRGHRTTSCGIPVCRSKVFWTVKRPGRPSNSCTCRYGGSGRCKCVVARSACPHKSKKGEKRSGECRCDEQGRYCCLIEPDQWMQLLLLQKPAVVFYPTRELLEASQRAQHMPMTPAYSVASPHHFNSSVPSPPASSNGLQTPQSTLAPQFGMMGIGGGRTDEYSTPDSYIWQPQNTPTPQSFPMTQMHQISHDPIHDPIHEVMERSCCSGSAQPSQQIPPSHHVPVSASSIPMGASDDLTPFLPSLTTVAAPEQLPITSSGFNYEKMTADYFHYQLPNAICQKCGLNGCTCKHCPPVMQNFATGSWAQCCGRKHARNDAVDVSQPIDRVNNHAMDPALSGITYPNYADPQFYDPHMSQDGTSQDAVMALQGTAALSGLGDFDLTHELTMPDGQTPMELSDLLMSELDRQDGGCGCRGP